LCLFWLQFFFQMIFYQRLLKMLRHQIHLNHHLYGIMGLLLVPSSVYKILLLSVYSCDLILVAVVVGAACISVFIHVTSRLVLAATVVGSRSSLPVAVSVSVVNTLHLKMRWPQCGISGPALFVRMPQSLAPAA
jgi:hypothetical protein